MLGSKYICLENIIEGNDGWGRYSTLLQRFLVSKKKKMFWSSERDKICMKTELGY